MSEPSLDQETSSVTKTHEEILAMFKEIKQLEASFPAYEIGKYEVEEELIEVAHEEEPILIEEPQIKKEPTSPTVFRLRYNEEGNLENIDMRKPKPHKEIHINLSKLRSKEKEPKVKEEIPKTSRFRGGLSKLKRIIPSRNEEEEETEEAEE